MFAKGNEFCEEHNYIAESCPWCEMETLKDDFNEISQCMINDLNILLNKFPNLPDQNNVMEQIRLIRAVVDSFMYQMCFTFLSINKNPDEQKSNQSSEVQP